MSLVGYTQSEAPQTARVPSVQFDMRKALFSLGHTKRKSTGDLIPALQENYSSALPTKRVCASPPVQQQWNAPPASGARESEPPHLNFVEFPLQNRIAAPAQTQSRPHFENVLQAHAGSMWMSPSLPGTLPDQPVGPQRSVDGRSQAERSPAEKSEVAKGKQPDSRHRKSKSRHHAPKPEAANSDFIAQQYLSFLTHNLMAQQMALQAELAGALVLESFLPVCDPLLNVVERRPAAATARLSEPEPQPCARSGFGCPEAPVVYASPFEGMLVKGTPWPATATVMQDMGCECSICIRALAKRLEDVVPSTATFPSPLLEVARVEEQPALEPNFVLDYDGVVLPDFKFSEARLPVETIPMPMPAPFPSHQFFPHMPEAPPGGQLENIPRSHCPVEAAGPSSPSVYRPPSPPGQDLFSMLLAVAMSDLANDA